MRFSHFFSHYSTKFLYFFKNPKIFILCVSQFFMRIKKISYARFQLQGKTLKCGWSRQHDLILLNKAYFLNQISFRREKRAYQFRQHVWNRSKEISETLDQRDEQNGYTHVRSHPFVHPSVHPSVCLSWPENVPRKPQELNIPNFAETYCLCADRTLLKHGNLKFEISHNKS